MKLKRILNHPKMNICHPSVEQRGDLLSNKLMTYMLIDLKTLGVLVFKGVDRAMMISLMIIRIAIIFLQLKRKMEDVGLKQRKEEIRSAKQKSN